MDPPPSAGHSLLEAIAATARTAFGAAACSIATLDDECEELIFLVVDGQGRGIVGQHQAANRGLAGWAVASGQALAVADVAHDPRFARELAEAAGYVPHTLLAAPMVARGKTLGVIEILDPATDTEASRSLELLGRFADEAALAADRQVVPAHASDQLHDDLMELGRLGEGERALAHGVVRAVLDYLTARR